MLEKQYIWRKHSTFFVLFSHVAHAAHIPSYSSHRVPKRVISIHELGYKSLFRTAVSTLLSLSVLKLVLFSYWVPWLFSLLPAPSPPHPGAELLARPTVDFFFLTCPSVDDRKSHVRTVGDYPRWLKEASSHVLPCELFDGEAGVNSHGGVSLMK